MENLEQDTPKDYILLIQNSNIAFLYLENINNINKWVLSIECSLKKWRKILAFPKNKDEGIIIAKSLGFGGVKICKHNFKTKKKWSIYLFENEKNWYKSYFGL